MTAAMKLSTYRGHAINDHVNYYSYILPTGYGGLPGVNVALGKRSGAWPRIGGVERPGRELMIETWIMGSDTDTLQKQLHQWFDPENETPGTLAILTDAGANSRYVKALCQNMQPVPGTKGLKWVITLTIDGDVRWREVTATTSSWNITASGQTKALTNNGQDDAYPILTITPTSGKTGGYSYKVFVTIKWNNSRSINKYPVDIVNNGFSTSTLVSGGKMQADGDDLRVMVDGVEVDRWLQDINTTTTQVWCNLDFVGEVETTLTSGITDSDTVIPVEGAYSDLTSLPAADGIIAIDSELITYTGISSSPLQFTGCTRGAKGTTAASHSAAAAVTWIQHDIWILYGNSSVSAPAVDDGFKPMFNLTSTNTSWDYDSFRYDPYPRTAAWTKEWLRGTPVFYGGNQGTTADPYVELGIKCTYSYMQPEGRFVISNICGITAANFANGQKYSDYHLGWSTPAKVKSVGYNDWLTWTDEYTIPAPTASSTWEAWSQNITLTLTPAYKVALWLTNDWYTKTNAVEAADVTLTLDSSATPTVTIGSEQGNYALACTITNTTTGYSIVINFNMALNEDLEVDTDAKTVTYLLDNSGQFAALSIGGGTRRDWLALATGSNTIQFTDTGTNAVTIGFEWEERHYQ